jgi:hypothetical protein
MGMARGERPRDGSLGHERYLYAAGKSAKLVSDARPATPDASMKIGYVNEAFVTLSADVRSETQTVDAMCHHAKHRFLPTQSSPDELFRTECSCSRYGSPRRLSVTGHCLDWRLTSRLQLTWQTCVLSSPSDSVARRAADEVGVFDHRTGEALWLPREHCKKRSV